MSSSYTRTASYTWTQSKVRYLMQKVLSDLIQFVTRGFMTSKQAEDWYNDLCYVLDNRAITRFEFQVSTPRGQRCGLRYELVEGEAAVSDIDAGGLDLWSMPNGSTVNVIISYREGLPNEAEIRREMARRGWGTGGVFLEGDGVQDRSYSRGGVGLRRKKMGVWDD